MRPARTIFAAFALISGAAATARAKPVPPPLPSDVYTDLQSAPTTSAVCILWLDALPALPVDQAAIDNNKVGAQEVPLTATKRPAVAAGESGGNGGG